MIRGKAVWWRSQGRYVYVSEEVLGRMALGKLQRVRVFDDPAGKSYHWARPEELALLAPYPEVVHGPQFAPVRSEVARVLRTLAELVAACEADLPPCHG